MSTYDVTSGLQKRAGALPPKLSGARLVAANASSFHYFANLSAGGNLIPVGALTSICVVRSNGTADTSAALPTAAAMITQFKSLGMKAGDALTVKFINNGAAANSVTLTTNTNVTIQSTNIIITANTARDVVFLYNDASNVYVY